MAFKTTLKNPAIEISTWEGLIATGPFGTLSFGTIGFQQGKERGWGHSFLKGPLLIIFGSHFNKGKTGRWALFFLKGPLLEAFFAFSMENIAPKMGPE